MTGVQGVGHILVVDNSHTVLICFTLALKQLGYQVSTASSGEEALRVVAATPPDLVLLDVNMPGVDGYEVCRKLKDDVATRDIPVLFLSAHEDSSSRLKGFENGGVDFITKSFRLKELEARVCTHLKLRGFQQELKEKNRHLEKRNLELEKALAKLHLVQRQRIQTEKMASIGTFSAGVAHEINNPIGYMSSNIAALSFYVEQLLSLTSLYEKGEASVGDQDALKAIANHKSEIDLPYLKEDLLAVMKETTEGIDRIRLIVQGLGDFSHAGQGKKIWSNLHQEIDSTLNIACNELKHKAQVTKEYGELPLVFIVPAQINQVLLNLLVNAAHSIKERGEVLIRTGTEGDKVWVDIQDTGSGIPSEHLDRIFEPFFTTKPVGKGIGLGLSLSYGLIQNHQGAIEVHSEQGAGSRFRLWLPINVDFPQSNRH